MDRKKGYQTTFRRTSKGRVSKPHKRVSDSSLGTGSVPVTSHEETIICPECGSIEKATVEHTFPWWSYVHWCLKCDYCIMESDWEKQKEQNRDIHG